MCYASIRFELNCHYISDRVPCWRCPLCVVSTVPYNLLTSIGWNALKQRNVIKDAMSTCFQIQPIKPDTQRNNCLLKIQGRTRLRKKSSVYGIRILAITYLIPTTMLSGAVIVQIQFTEWWYRSLCIGENISVSWVILPPQGWTYEWNILLVSI